MARKKRRTALDDITELTALNIGSTVGITTMYSLPDTGIPAVESAKGFAGQAMGLLPVLKGADMLLCSVGELERIGKKGSKWK